MFQVFFLCLLSGCSICWFNTVCFVLCIKNFPVNRSLALALTVSFNGVSAALYTLAANSINPSSDQLYLLLNALVPLLTSIAALLPILRQPPLSDTHSPHAARQNSVIFLTLNILAVFTGIYLLIFASSTSDEATSRLYFGGALILMISPLCIPGVIYARDWFHRAVHPSLRVENSSFILVHVNDLELHKELLTRQNSARSNGDAQGLLGENGYGTQRTKSSDVNCEKFFGQDQLEMLGEEHSAAVLVKRLDFWLYYIAYFCGGTIGLVYSNNLGQIAQSLGHSYRTSTLVTLYSSFSFFGRLLSAMPDYIRK